MEDIEEIIKHFENESYNEYIQRILNSRENVKNTEFYQEKHHIIPKCLGGLDTKENLRWATQEEIDMELKNRKEGGDCSNE